MELDDVGALELDEDLSVPEPPGPSASLKRTVAAASKEYQLLPTAKRASLSTAEASKRAAEPEAAPQPVPPQTSCQGCTLQLAPAPRPAQSAAGCAAAAPASREQAAGEEERAAPGQYIPGPAGLLQQALVQGLPLTQLGALRLGAGVSGPQSGGASSSLADRDFLAPAWVAALRTLGLSAFDGELPYLFVRLYVRACMHAELRLTASDIVPYSAYSS